MNSYRDPFTSSGLAALRDLPPVRAVLKSRYKRRFETARGTGALSGVYATFEEAAQAAPREVPCGYDTPASAALYRDRMHTILPKDYPALFWLSQVLPGTRSLVDVGGHVGVLFYAFRNYVGYPEALRWTVCDVPAVTAEGEALARERGETQLGFTTRFEDAAAADVVLAVGSLQYIPRSLGSVLAAHPARPRHIIVNQTPTHPKREFYTLQNIGVAYCPYRIAAHDALPDALAPLGYDLVDSWEDPMRRTVVPYHPESGPIAYSGYYFRLR